MEAKGKYSEQSGEIQIELSMLKEKLKRHKASFKKESNNWGYIGSLSHVLNQLKEINSFLK